MDATHIAFQRKRCASLAGSSQDERWCVKRARKPDAKAQPKSATKSTSRAKSKPATRASSASDSQASTSTPGAPKKCKGKKIDLDDPDDDLPATLPAKRKAANNVWKSLFMKTEIVPTAGFGGTPLDNTIHPLFAESQFEGVDDYEVLRMPARLATNLLESEALPSMFWTMLNHRELYDECYFKADRYLHELPERDHGGEKQYAYRSPVDSEWYGFEAHGKLHISAALVNLVPFVHFRISDTPAEGAVTNGLVGEEVSYEEHGGRADLRPYPMGVKTETNISRNTYSRLRDATNDYDDDNGDLAYLLQLQFEFAVMLMHEICHCLLWATEGELGYEPFFPASDDADPPDFEGVARTKPTAELGFEAETRLFGGYPAMLFDDCHVVRLAPISSTAATEESKLQGVPVCWKWPHGALLSKYRSEGDYIGVRTKQLPSMELAWRVPIEYFAKLFTNEFWDEGLSRRGAAALRMPMEVGHFFAVNKKSGNMGPRKPGKGQVPEGWRLATSRDTTIIRSKAKKYQPQKEEEQED